MDQRIAEFLSKEHIGVVSVLLNGAPYSATVHFSHEDNPFKIFIQTSKASNKVKPFLNGEIAPASMVVGFSEKDWITIQMQGSMRVLTDPQELERAYNAHHAKHPGAEQYKGPDTVLLEFSPTWWRYTDFNTDPETVIETS